jgi:uncharacterized protein YjbJ (UPF0337 family)
VVVQESHVSIPTYRPAKFEALNGHPFVARVKCLARNERLEEDNNRHIMNTQITKGNWNIAKGKLKQKYADLTDDDLEYVEGREDELLGRLQRKTGRKREEIEKFIDDAYED